MKFVGLNTKMKIFFILLGVYNFGTAQIIDTVNVAQGKTLTSLRNNNSSYLAIDGNLAQTDAQCLDLTQVRGANWEVDLGRAFNISYIRLYTKDTSCACKNVIDIYVSETTQSFDDAIRCRRIDRVLVDNVTTIYCDRPMYGRFVSFIYLYLSKMYPYKLCEFQVFVEKRYLSTLPTTQESTISHTPSPTTTSKLQTTTSSTLSLPDNNIALNKKVYVNSDPSSQNRAQSVVVNNLPGCYRSNLTVDPWLMVDLGQPYDVTGVLLESNLDICTRIYVQGLEEDNTNCFRMNKGFQVYISNDKSAWLHANNLCYSSIGEPLIMEKVFCKTSLIGRYVFIRVPSVSHGLASLTFCHVQIHGETYGCNFNDGKICRWNSQPVTKWKPTSWSTLSTDSQKSGYFLQLKRDPSSTSKYGDFNGPTLPGGVDYCVSFWYNIRNLYSSSGSLLVYRIYTTKHDNTYQSIELFTATGDLSTNWRKNNTLVLQAINEPSHLRFQGKLPQDARVWIGIDEITVTHCPKDGAVTPPPTVSPISGDNVALKKFAYSKQKDSLKSSATLAVDGNTDQNFDKPDTCYSSLKMPHPTWTVDLGQVYEISSLRMYLPNTICKDIVVNDAIDYNFRPCYLMDTGYQVHITNDTNSQQNQLCYTQKDAIGSVETFNCLTQAYGRYVSVSLPYNSSESRLVICEMQVFIKSNITTTPLPTTTVKNLTVSNITTTPLPTTTTKLQTTAISTASPPDFKPCPAVLCEDKTKCRERAKDRTDCVCPREPGLLGECYRTLPRSGKLFNKQGKANVLVWAVPVGVLLVAAVAAAIVTVIVLKRKYANSELYTEEKKSEYDQQNFDNPIYADLTELERCMF